MIAFDFIMGVGKKYYPTPQDFIREAEQYGISKRIGKIPKGLILGESKIFLVHWGTKEIFGFFVPMRIDVIGEGEEIDNIAEKLKERGYDVREVSSLDTLNEPERGCGTRVYSGAYLVSGNANDMDDVKKVLSDMVHSGKVRGEVHGALVTIDPISYSGAIFRGIRYAAVDIEHGTYIEIPNPFK